MEGFMKSRLGTGLLTVLVSSALLLLFSCQTTPPGKENPHDILGIAPVEFPAELTAAVKSSPKEHLPELVSYINEQAETEREKVLYAHDWIAQNVAYDLKQKDGEAERITDAYGVIAHGKSVCSGYANAFKLLLDELDVENKLLNGYSRGGSFQPFREEEREADETNHAWTAVRLEDTWHLIDSTWNAGSTSPTKGFRFQYDRDYYMIPAEDFLYTHFNPNSKWQLVNDPVSYQEFVKMPYLRGSFFRLGMQPAPNREKITVIREKAEDSLLLPFPRRRNETLRLRSTLTDADSGDRHRNYSLTEPVSEDLARILVRFPGPGQYRLSLDAQTDDNQFYNLGAYFFDVKSLDDPLPPFPRLHPRFYQLGLKRDESHAGLTVIRDKAEDSLLFPRPSKADNELGLWCSLENMETEEREEGRTLVEPAGEDKVKVRVRFPGPGRYALVMSAFTKRRDFHYLGRYFFDVKSLREPLPPFPEVYLRAQEMGVRSLQPSDGVLPTDQELTLSFSSQKNRRFYVRADEEYIRVHFAEDSQRYEVEVPPVSESLYLAVALGQGYRYLAKYQVE
jgi:hypothetical protein